MKMNGKLSFAGQERQISKGKMLKLKVRPDSQFLHTRVYILCDFLWPEVDSQMHVNCSVFSVRLAPQCCTFSSLVS